jgi:PAS domain S-box-containing protein
MLPRDSTEQTDDAGLESEAVLRCQNHALELIARGTPLPETLTVLVRALEALSPEMLGSILLIESDGVHVRHVAAPSLPDAYVRAIDGQSIGPAAGSCGTAAYRREPVIVEDIATDSLWAPYREFALAHGLRACWSTPIFDGAGNVLGTFALYFRTPRSPTTKHLRLIEMTTYTVAIAIVQSRERHEAARRAVQLEEAQRIAKIGSYEWDVRTNDVKRSDELCRIFGLRPHEFAPSVEAYLERVHPDDRQRTRETIEGSIRDASPFDFEERIVRPDGTTRQLRSQGRWIRDAEDQPIKLVGICQDVTERRQVEEQLRRSAELRIRNEELKAFAYMVSHDLKAPLRSIAGYARELDQHRNDLTARGTRCVEEILAAAQNLDRMIEDLLHYSRLDAETPTATDVDLQELIEHLLRQRRPLIAAEGIEVDVRLAVTHVSTWERGLEQMLTNLIDNALKYRSEVRPPRIRIASDVRGDSVIVSVSDNGIGFDMAYHDRIFGLFNRLVRHEQYEGTGAGLAIVRKVADKIGARVWAESAAGSGATFYVELSTTAATG